MVLCWNGNKRNYNQENKMSIELCPDCKKVKIDTDKQQICDYCESNFFDEIECDNCINHLKKCKKCQENIKSLNK